MWTDETLTSSSSRDVKHGVAEADRKPRNLNVNAKEGQSGIFLLPLLPVRALSLVTDERPAAKCETPPFQSDAAPLPASRGEMQRSAQPSPNGSCVQNNWP